MRKLNSKELRQVWLDYFESKGHLKVESKSLIPVNDPSLLWINSGVATLKDYFSGTKVPPSPRLTNSQKSIRTNDIENVGVTARHHTFFEMLGNFSIGDYFKKEAIAFAYEFLFEVLEFKKEKIYITYFEEDKETFDTWLALGVEESHLLKGDREMNFWDIGQGPCGPDTEIFYDRGVKYDPENIGIKLCAEDIENDRYIEIWNIVFSEFNNDGTGNYAELAQKNIDTGAGLERIASIFQDAPTNFDTDLFLPIIAEIEKLSGAKYIIENFFIGNDKQRDINKKFKVIADHIRAITVAIQDGAVPSNTARGYIIRRLIRRAYRAGIELGVKGTNFLSDLLPSVADVLDIFKFDLEMISKIIVKEENLFSKTLEKGEALLEKSIKGKNELDFAVAFKLFETYGFPIELTAEILEEKGISLDISKFDEYKAKHADASRGEKVEGMSSQINALDSVEGKVSEFIGYESLETSSRVKITKEENGKYYTLTNRTPFYATGGGQSFDNGTIAGVHVIDVIKDKYGNHWHVTKTPVEGVRVELVVDSVKRLRSERNHSATHLVSHALSEVLGVVVKQAGSYNDDQRLRFDFKSDSKPTEEQVLKVEELVNSYISSSLERKTSVSTYDEAVKNGAVALDGETYDADVRVVDLEVSKELCGGVHVDNTSQIQNFKITKMSTKGSGIFRVEAVTSNRKVDEFNDAVKDQLLIELRRLIAKNTKDNKDYKLDFQDDIQSIKESIEKAKADNKALKTKIKNNDIDFDSIVLEDIDGKKVYRKQVDSMGQVKSMAISLRNHFKEALIIISCEMNGNNLAAVASFEYDCTEEFYKVFPDAKAGGNKEFVMGKF